MPRLRFSCLQSESQIVHRQMRFTLIATAFAFSLPLFSEPLKVEFFNEVMELVHEGHRLDNEHKTVKADRKFAEANALLKKLRQYKTMSFPAGCTFEYSNHMFYRNLIFTCAGLSLSTKFSSDSKNDSIHFLADTSDPKILEQLEDCKGNCTGDFIITGYTYGNDESVWFNKAGEKAITLKIKFLNVKQVKKQNEPEAVKENAPAKVE